MPEITLDNDEKLQTGTVGARLRDSFAYNDLIRSLHATGSEGRKEEFRTEAVRFGLMLKTPLPLLHRVDLPNLSR